MHANPPALRPNRPPGGADDDVGTGRRISLVGAIDDAPGTAPEPRLGPARAGDVRDAKADRAAIGDALGYAPVVASEERLRRTLAWMAAAAGGPAGAPTVADCPVD